MTNMIQINTELMQKADNLPRYIEIPASEFTGWELRGTTPVEVSLNGVNIGRRNLKYWGASRDYWFLEITKKACKKFHINTGDKVFVVLKPASADLPTELSVLLKSSAKASFKWNSMTQSRQRMLIDHVQSAKQVETRVRRAKRALIED